MSSEQSANFEKLVALIKQVKPSIADKAVSANDSITEELGLDSLDVLQLARKVRREIDNGFELDAWTESHAAHRCTVASLLAVLSEVSAG
jgi:acyl carrier protein